MSQRSLIILSKVYPFYPEFLQNEVPYIEKNYDRVILIACSNTREECITQPVGQNFSVYSRKDTSNRFCKYAKYIFKGIQSKDKRAMYSDELTAANGLRQRLAILYTIGKAESVLHFVISVLKDFQFCDEEDIFIYSYWFTDTALVACFLKNELKARKIIAFTRAHGGDLYEDRNISKTIPFREYCLANLDRVYPCSIAGEKYLRKRYPLHQTKIKHEYLGIPDIGHTNDVQNGDGLFHIISCSNIIPLKRLDLLVDALVVLEKRGIDNIFWTCFGNGKSLDSVKRQSSVLRKIKVEFMGATKNKDILQYYINEPIDLFINVSSSEGLPVSIMEAMSAGIPVIATAVGGTSEIVTDGYNGYLLDQDILSEDLANKIEQYMSKEEYEIRRMRENARNTFLEQFNSENNYNVFHNNVIGLSKTEDV